jgi:amino acid permease
LGNAGIDSGTAFKSSILALLLIGITGLGYIYKAEKDSYNFRRNNVFQFYIVLFSVYVAVSFVATGILGAQIHLNHILYVVNILVAVVLLFKVGNPFITLDENASTLKPKHWLAFVIVLLAIVLLALLLVNMHGELAGSQNRFEIIQQQTVTDTIK